MRRLHVTLWDLFDLFGQKIIPAASCRGGGAMHGKNSDSRVDMAEGKAGVLMQGGARSAVEGCSWLQRLAFFGRAVLGERLMWMGPDRRQAF